MLRHARFTCRLVLDGQTIAVLRVSGREIYPHPDSARLFPWRADDAAAPRGLGALPATVGSFHL